MDPDTPIRLYGGAHPEDLLANFEVTTYNLPGAELISIKNIFDDPTEWFHALRDEIPFQQEQSFVHGKMHEQPRLTRLLGERSYSYSGKKRIPIPMTPALGVVRDYIQELTHNLQPERAADYPDAFLYHSVIANLYTSGLDHIGRHSDKAKELIPEGYIASLTLLENPDEPRFFDLYPRITRGGRAASGPRIMRLALESGELLLMGPGVQEGYLHECQAQKAIQSERINLTFRPLHAWAAL